MAVRKTASRRNCHRISRRRAPDRLAGADLARPFLDRDGHDRHHPDAADEQRDRRDRDQGEEGRAADLVPQPERGVLGHDVEVVWLVEPQPVADAHHLRDVADRVLARDPFARYRADQQELQPPAAAIA